MKRGIGVIGCGNGVLGGWMLVIWGFVEESMCFGMFWFGPSKCQIHEEKDAIVQGNRGLCEAVVPSRSREPCHSRGA